MKKHFNSSRSGCRRFHLNWFAATPLSKAITGLLAASMLYCGAAWSADEPSYKNGVLTIPTVSTDDQVGQYQDVTLRMDAQGLWQLTNVRAVGGDQSVFRSVYLAPVSEVAPIETTGAPAQVLLRVSGTFTSGCGSPGRISQRLVGNRFDILLADGFTSYDVALCTAVMTPYVKTIPLPVYGLSTGTYSYNVNGVSGSFVLPAANEIAGDCLGSAACQK